MNPMQAYTILKKSGRRNIRKFIEEAPPGHGAFREMAFKTFKPGFTVENDGSRTVAFFINANYQEIESSLRMKCR